MSNSSLQEKFRTIYDMGLNLHQKNIYIRWIVEASQKNGESYLVIMHLDFLKVSLLRDGAITVRSLCDTGRNVLNVRTLAESIKGEAKKNGEDNKVRDIQSKILDKLPNGQSFIYRLASHNYAHLLDEEKKQVCTGKNIEDDYYPECEKVFDAIMELGEIIDPNWPHIRDLPDLNGGINPFLKNP